MKAAWRRVRVPVVGLIAVALITLIAFAAVKPDALRVQRDAWTITGNAIVDSKLYGNPITVSASCADVQDPVCGTDGTTYANLCEARKAGVDMRSRGECPSWVKE